MIHPVLSIFFPICIRYNNREHIRPAPGNNLGYAAFKLSSKVCTCMFSGVAITTQGVCFWSDKWIA